MLDMRYLRRNPEEAGRRLARRGGDYEKYAWVLPELLEHWRYPTAEVEGLDAAKNKLSKQIGLWKRKPPKPEERAQEAQKAWALLQEVMGAVQAAARYFMPMPAMRGATAEEVWTGRLAPHFMPQIADSDEAHLSLGTPAYHLSGKAWEQYRDAEKALVLRTVPSEFWAADELREQALEGERRAVEGKPPPEPDWAGLQSEAVGAPAEFWDALFDETLRKAVSLCEEAKDLANHNHQSIYSDPLAKEGGVSSPSLLPNIPSDETPDGAGEADNLVLRTHDAKGKEVAEDFAPTKAGAAPHHVDVGEALGGFHAERGVAMSGSRFVVLSGELARLHRALGAWMLDLHLQEHGYTEWTVPHLLTWEAAEGSGQLPKFEEDIFQVRGTGRGADGEERPMVLISTSEMALLNVWRDSILDEGQLPQRLTALTPCYRREAGAAGKDTRGLIRLHQFEKVEMVQFCHPEQSGAALREMLGHAEKVLQLLRLPYRVLDLCAGDLGFAANRTFDLEVWLPGAAKDGGAWREISSCSNCGDFQARRAAVRFRPEGGGKPQYLHTLNGSGVAVGRCLAAVLENYHREGRGVEVPAVLRPYMGGQELLPFAQEAGEGG